jgi:hypothetical protein
MLVNSTGGSHSRSSIGRDAHGRSRVRFQGGLSASYAAMKTSAVWHGGSSVKRSTACRRACGSTAGWRLAPVPNDVRVLRIAGTYVVKNLYLDAGIRVEHVGASARGAAAGIAWTSFEPRASLRYKYDDRWSGSITARRYHPVLPLTT